MTLGDVIYKLVNNKFSLSVIWWFLLLFVVFPILIYVFAQLIFLIVGGFLMGLLSIAEWVAPFLKWIGTFT